MEKISWDDFEKIDIRVGTVLSAEINQNAKKAALIVFVDFGNEIGTLKTSAQISELYDPSVLLGRQVLGVVNFPKKQIGHFMSECLILGIHNEENHVVLVSPDRNVPNGRRLM